MVSVPTWLRARGFGFSNYDFGIYSQAVARLALDPPNPWLSGRQLFVFNDHFDPILFLTLPFARVFPAAQVGLITEALCALLALAPLAWLAHEGRIAPRTTWLLGGLMSLGIGVTQALGFPFHPTTWAMAPMAWLLAALWLERWAVSLVALVVLFACKEEFPFVGLALIPYLFFRAPRRFTWGVLALSLAWGLFAFVLRPRLFGQVMPYASVPFRGLEDGLGVFLAMRFSPSVLAGAGDLIVAFVPLLAWLGWQFKKGERPAPRVGWLLFALVPMLGIRFLAMAWREHYGAVVVAAAVMGLAAVIGKRTLPTWVLISTLLLLALTNEQVLRRDFKSLTHAQGWAASSGCIDGPERISAVARGVELVRHAPGPLFVSGNLLPWLAERDDVYAFGGPQPASIVPRTVLIERPPCGDTWAQSLSEREALLVSWERREDVRVVLSDEATFAGAAP